MSFKQWLEEEIKWYSSIDLTKEGKIYLDILYKINFYDNIKNIESFIRTNIKDNIHKKRYQYIYRQFLICEGYIEKDEIS